MLKQLIQAILAELLSFLEKRANTPNTITDANTPKSIRDSWAAYLRDKLRDKGGGN